MIATTENSEGDEQLSSLSATVEANAYHDVISPKIPTKFENLSVELILIIFDLCWTETYVLYNAFYNLNLRLNNILQQTKAHITGSSYSLVPHIIHPEQIKSLYYRAGKDQEKLTFLTSLSPETIVSLKLKPLFDDDSIRSLLPSLTNLRNLKTLNLHVPYISKHVEQELYQIISQMTCLQVK